MKSCIESGETESYCRREPMGDGDTKQFLVRNTSLPRVRKHPREFRPYFVTISAFLSKESVATPAEVDLLIFPLLSRQNFSERGLDRSSDILPDTPCGSDFWPSRRLVEIVARAMRGPGQRVAEPTASPKRVLSGEVSAKLEVSNEPDLQEARKLIVRSIRQLVGTIAESLPEESAGQETPLGNADGRFHERYANAVLYRIPVSAYDHCAFLKVLWDDLKRAAESNGIGAMAGKLVSRENQLAILRLKREQKSRIAGPIRTD